MLLVILEEGNGSSIREREGRLGRFDLFHVVDAIRLVIIFGENRGSDDSLSKSMLELRCSILAIVVVVVIAAMEIIVNVGHHIIDGVRPQHSMAYLNIDKKTAFPVVNRCHVA